MNDDVMSDSTLRELHDQGAAMVLPEPPDLGLITARGGARRRRHRSAVTAVAVAGAAASVVLGLGLTGAFSPATGHGGQTIKTVAFTLVDNADGTATLTLNPTELFDPVTLQQDLAGDNIPAVVMAGQFCTSDPTPAGFSQVVTFPPITSQPTGSPSPTPEPDPTITIDPTALPSGAELSIGDFQVANGQQAALTLVTQGAYSCTSTVPTTLPPGGALLHLGVSPGS